jgi:hypothetical protein
MKLWQNSDGLMVPGLEKLQEDLLDTVIVFIFVVLQSIVDTLIAYVEYCFRHKVLQSICHEFRQ